MTSYTEIDRALDAPFKPGDLVVSEGWRRPGGNATVLECYLEPERVGTYWNTEAHWRARIKFGPLPAAPIWNVDCRHLKLRQPVSAHAFHNAMELGRALRNRHSMDGPR